MVIDVPALPAPARSSGRSTTCGSAGSPTSACPGPIAARAASTCSWGPAMTARCPTAASTSPMSARRARACWAGRSWSTTTPPRPSRRSRPASASARTGRERRAPRSRASSRPRAARRPRRPPPETRFVDAVHLAMNTIPPNDFGYWETIDEVVQQEPAGAGDPEILGPARRGRDPQGQAVRARRADARDPRGRRRRRQRHRAHALLRAARVGGLRLLPGLGVVQHALGRRLRVPDPPPEITADGVGSSPSDGARKLNSRIAFLYPATGVTPAMCMRLTGHRLAVPDRYRATPTANSSTATGTTGSTCRRTFPRAASGR